MKLAKNSNAFHELLGSDDFQLGAGSDLLSEVPCIRGEEPVVSNLPLPIEALEALPTYLFQVLQSLPDRDPSSCQRRLDSLAEMVKGLIVRYNHQSLTEPDEKDLTSFRKLVYLTVIYGNRNLPLLSHANSSDRLGQQLRHQKVSSFVSQCFHDKNSPSSGALQEEEGGSWAWP